MSGRELSLVQWLIVLGLGGGAWVLLLWARRGVIRLFRETEGTDQ